MFWAIRKLLEYGFLGRRPNTPKPELYERHYQLEVRDNYRLEIAIERATLKQSVVNLRDTKMLVSFVSLSH